MEKLYRYVDDFPHNKARLVELPIVKRTPKGVRVKMYPWDKETRFVLLSGTKRYAWPTEEEAFASFLYRKISAVHHAKRRLQDANRQMSIAVGMAEKKRAFGSK